MPSVRPIASCTNDRRRNSHAHVVALRAERHAHADLLRALRHRIRRDRVEADRRQRQRNHREDREHRAEDAERPARLRQRCVHRADAEERQVGIDRAHFLAQDRRHRVRIAGAAHQQGHEAARVGPERQVGDRIGIRQLEIALTEVRGRCRRRWRSARAGCRRAGGAPPCRSIVSVMRRPIGSSFGKCSAAKRWLMIAASRPGHAVFVGQVAAALQRQADGLEVVRIDRQHRHVGRLLSLVERLAVDVSLRR